ncbi:MAG: hypothetical protein HYY06_23170 [Deltaproteobacteria bacterium]|nr:hypothetical protein [Deltaproteobacteria bacterium]
MVRIVGSLELGLLAWLAGCGPEEVLRERAVAVPVGKVQDLQMVALDGGGWALGWRESDQPNGAEAKAAFLLLDADRTPESDVLRDTNPSFGASELVASEGAILRVLIEKDDASVFGLVMTVREATTGALQPQGYRTLPIFAAGEITMAHLAPTARGALLAWVERTGSADLVQLAGVDPDGQLTQPPRALADAPARVARMSMTPTTDGRVALALSGQDGGDGRIWVVLASEDEPFVADVARQIGPAVDREDVDVDVASSGSEVQVLFTFGGSPRLASLDVSTGSVDPSPRELAASGEVVLRPRLERVGSRLLFVRDRPDGSSVATPAETAGEAPFEWPLGPTRCSEVATVEGDPLPYACSGPCRTRDCGDEWIFAGTADL